MDEIKNWYQDGLQFKCTGCGKCCTGSPGYVFLSDSDLVSLSNHFKMSSKDFAKKYTRQVDDQLALLEDQTSYDCVFLKNNQCIAYEARPVQCRTFPWWIENLRTIDDWNEAALRCEGINHKDAPLISAVEIEAEVLTYLDNLSDFS